MENEMVFTRRDSAFARKPKNPLSSAHERWEAWCKSKSKDAKDFKDFLEANGIYVDRDTARRWRNGETLPSAARIIEIEAAGATGLVDAIFKPAILLGNKQARTAAIQEQRKKIERHARELEELYQLPD